MISDLRVALKAAEEDGPAIRLLRAVLGALPPEACLEGRGGLSGLLTDPPTACSIAEGDDASSSASLVAEALDYGDIYAALAAAPRVALSLYDAHLEWALGVGDLERDQARDAAIRLHGIGLLAQRLFDGSTPERAGELLSYEAGRGLIVWFIAVELILAMSTEEDPASVQSLRDLIDQHGEAAIQELSHLASRADREAGQAVIKAMLGVIGPVVPAAVAAVAGVAGAVRRSLSTLQDNGPEALAEEAGSVLVYRLLVARLVAEIEVESSTIHTPPPVPEPQTSAAVLEAQAALDTARGRLDDAPLSEAGAELQDTASRMNSLAVQIKAHKKEHRATKRKLERTIDRRARMAEAPPASRAEAQAAVARAHNALKEAKRNLSHSQAQVSTSEEAVTAATAALSRASRAMSKSHRLQAEAQAAVALIEARIASLREDDRTHLQGIAAAELAAEKAEAARVVAMGERVDDARARLEAIEAERPVIEAQLGEVTANFAVNHEAFTVLTQRREELADGLVGRRESSPELRSQFKDRAAALAQAEINQESAAKLILEARARLKAAQTANRQAEKASAGARDKCQEARQVLQVAQQGATIAADVEADLRTRMDETRIALKANLQAQKAVAAAAAAARVESMSALERALTSARSREEDREEAANGLHAELKILKVRVGLLTVEGKTLTKAMKIRRTKLKTGQLVKDKGQEISAKAKQLIDTRTAALKAGVDAHKAQTLAVRKTSAAHAGAAARVVGARDALNVAVRRLTAAQASRAQAVGALTTLQAAVRASQAAVAHREESIAAMSVAPIAGRSGGPPEIGEILDALQPTIQADPTQPVETWLPDAPPDPGATDDDATAMFSPAQLKSRIEQEQSGEEDADATVMFTRDQHMSRVEEEPPEEEDEDATEMFTRDPLKSTSEEEDPQDAATQIFRRRPGGSED